MPTFCLHLLCDWPTYFNVPQTCMCSESETLLSWWPAAQHHLNTVFIVDPSKKALFYSTPPPQLCHELIPVFLFQSLFKVPAMDAFLMKGSWNLRLGMERVLACPAVWRKPSWPWSREKRHSSLWNLSMIMFVSLSCLSCNIGTVYCLAARRSWVKILAWDFWMEFPCSVCTLVGCLP